MQESNYVRQARDARALFLPWDQEAMIHRWNLTADASYLYLWFLAQTYRICRTTGQIDRLVDGPSPLNGPPITRSTAVWEEVLDFSVVMSLYDILCREQVPPLSGVWLSIHALPGVVQSRKLGNFIFERGAAEYTGRSAALSMACKALGGRQLTGSADVAWEIPILPFFPIQLRFWDADEEFPAKLNILWDRSTPGYFHYETLYYIGGCLFSRLKELSGS